MSPRKKYLLFPHRADPRNETCARLSRPLLALELLGLFLFSSMPAFLGTESELWSRLLWMFLFVVPTIFILVGMRGLASDRKRKLASGCLVLVNLLLVGIVVQMYRAYARGY